MTALMNNHTVRAGEGHEVTVDVHSDDGTVGVRRSEHCLYGRDSRLGTAQLTRADRVSVRHQLQTIGVPPRSATAGHI